MAKVRAANSNHAMNGHYCSCGKVVWGNGGKAGHQNSHKRKQDSHAWLTKEEWAQMMTERAG